MTIKALLTTFLILTITLSFCVKSVVRIDTKPSNSLPISDSMFLKASVPAFTPHYQVLGSLIGIDRIIKQANLTPYPELNRIIWHESSNEYTAQNPNSSAFGLCQMINSTQEWVAKDIFNESGHMIDYTNVHDQIKACIFLYENGNPENEWAETMYLWKK